MRQPVCCRGSRLENRYDPGSSATPLANKGKAELADRAQAEVQFHPAYALRRYHNEAPDGISRSIHHHKDGAGYFAIFADGRFQRSSTSGTPKINCLAPLPMYYPIIDGAKGNVQQEPDRSYQPDANENRGNP